MRALVPERFGDRPFSPAEYLTQGFTIVFLWCRVCDCKVGIPKSWIRNRILLLCDHSLTDCSVPKAFEHREESLFVVIAKWFPWDTVQGAGRPKAAGAPFRLSAPSGIGLWLIPGCSRDFRRVSEIGHRTAIWKAHHIAREYSLLGLARGGVFNRALNRALCRSASCI